MARGSRKSEMPIFVVCFFFVPYFDLSCLEVTVSSLNVLDTLV